MSLRFIDRLYHFQEGEAEDLGLKLDRLKKDEKERVRKIKNLEGNISRLEAELAKPAVKLEKNEDLVNEMVPFNSLCWRSMLIMFVELSETNQPRALGSYCAQGGP